MKRHLPLWAALVALVLALPAIAAEAFTSGPGWLEFPAGKGPGAGKHVVLLAGDEEYRSEEALPMLARILSERQGFKCTVLFSHDDGVINPNNGGSLGKPEALDSADALVLGLRFRKWNEAALAKFDAAIKRGVPIVATRTSTHAFSGIPKESAFVAYNWNNKGGFGKNVLGETWVSHWGNHKGEATRTAVEPGAEKLAILNGVGVIFGDTDVYEAYPPADAQILLRGLVLKGMNPQDPLSERAKKRATDKLEQGINSPAMAVAWTREVPNAGGTKNRVFTTTMASASDLADESLRRLVVNGVFWGLGLEVPAKADVTPVVEWKPSKYSFNMFHRGLKAEDFAGVLPPPVTAPPAKKKK
ncbi:MAG: hypothetical protein CAK86_01365 [Opitutia bacterium AMD-G1]|nr:MAG: hypothetical protein CAK86_01365 [Opitutae bacterium AMD-G1]